MYLPKHYEETRLDELQQLMREHPLATIITPGSDGINANHIPMHLDAAAGQFGTLRGHVARANPMWRDLTPGVGTLVIFHGPNTYISPQWNPAKQQHGKVVPTWNYAVVHCHGILRILDTPQAARRNVDELTASHEAAFAKPWTLDEAPPDYTEKMLAAIVGIELEISKISGKWKTSQNHPPAAQHGVVQGLRAQGGDEALHMADLVAQRIRQPDRAPD